MSKQKTAQARYMVSIYDEPNAPSVLRFTFVPKGLQQVRIAGALPNPVPEYILTVKRDKEELAFTWLKAPQKESTKATLEDIARERVTDRAVWIQRILDLVTSIEGWAKEFGWSTKRISKKIEDPRLGNHTTAGLVMQEDTVRVLLEPISASAPASEGLADLYLMPGYDDIATLYYREGHWHVHYVFLTQKAIAGIKEGESRPLSKKTLGVVLEVMKKHAE